MLNSRKVSSCLALHQHSYSQHNSTESRNFSNTNLSTLSMSTGTIWREVNLDAVWSDIQAIQSQAAGLFQALRAFPDQLLPGSTQPAKDSRRKQLKKWAKAIFGQVKRLRKELKSQQGVTSNPSQYGAQPVLSGSAESCATAIEITAWKLRTHFGSNTALDSFRDSAKVIGNQAHYILTHLSMQPAPGAPILPTLINMVSYDKWHRRRKPGSRRHGAGRLETSRSNILSTTMKQCAMPRW